MHPGQHARNGAVVACLLAAAWLAGCAATPVAVEDASPHWVASWGSAQAVPWNEFVPAEGEWNDTSLRQIVNMSLSAKRLRVRVSNVHGATPWRSRRRACARGEAGHVRHRGRDPAQPCLRRPARRHASSGGEYFRPRGARARRRGQPRDHIAFRWCPGGADRSIRARATSFIVKGNRVRGLMAGRKAASRLVAHRGCRGARAASVGVLVAIGDSITDGHGATTDGNDRWTDALVQRMRREASDPWAW